MDDENSSLITILIVLLMAVASAALVVTVYHCITRPAASAGAADPENGLGSRSWGWRTAAGTPSNSVENSNSLAELIPAHRYEKETGLVKEDDRTCAVCLCEFEEGEELRTLPECVHSFHASCIDMWLFSHTSCPVCRTDAAPFPGVLMHALQHSDYYERLDITNNPSDFEPV